LRYNIFIIYKLMKKGPSNTAGRSGNNKG